MTPALKENTPDFAEAGSAVTESDLIESLRQNIEPEPDETHPRYGASFLLPVPFQNQDGNRYIGDFNPKYRESDDVPPSYYGQNKVNRAFYPAFTFMPILGGNPLIPFEKPLEYVDKRPTGVFNLQNAPKVGTLRQQRSPRECMANAVRFFSDAGFAEFHSLVGYRVFTQDRGVAAAARLFRIILPVGDKTVFKPSRRARAGHDFNAPFLDEIIEHLETKSLDALEKANLLEDDYTKGRALYQEILTGAKNAWKIARGILNSTHEQIKKGEKVGYDMPDKLHTGALEPVDLYCLAHLNEVEADLRQLKASEDRNREMGEALSTNFADAIRTVMKEFRTEQPTPQNILTPEQVKEITAQIIADEREKMRAELAAEFGAQTAPETAAKTKK